MPIKIKELKQLIKREKKAIKLLNKSYKICKFTPHHMAGILTGEQCGKIFQNPNRQASSNYGIGNDGRICESG